MRTYILAARDRQNQDTIVDIGGVSVGGGAFTVIAGPCSVESREQITDIAKTVKEKGATALRGGCWKPRTSPYSFQGMGEDGLRLLQEAGRVSALPIITEVTDPANVYRYVDDVDCFQVGAKNMQNFDLLIALGRVRKPVLLKRSVSATYEELLMAAEYILHEGNPNVILCERGIRTGETFTRNTLDISAVPALKKLTHLPIVVDPSHASGMAWMVEPLSLAAMAAGADGLIVEVHNDPANARSDGEQSLTYDMFGVLMEKLRRIAPAVNRKMNQEKA